MVNSADAQRATQFFLRGTEAVKKGNHPYALEMFRDACKLAPDNIQYRQSLRGTQRLVFGNNPSKVGMIAAARATPARSRAKSLRQKGRFAEALEAIEDAFAHHPWDLASAIELAEIYEAMNLPLQARWAMQSVFEQGKEDVHFLKHLAHVLRINKQYEAAAQCLEKVRQLKPSEDVAQLIKDIYAEQAMNQTEETSASSGTVARISLTRLAHSQSSPDPEEGPDELSSNPSDAQSDAEAARATATRSPEQRLLDEIKANPDAPGPYLRAADHFRNLGRLEEAEKILARALKRLPDDELIARDLAEVQLERITKLIGEWEKRLQAQPDDPTAQANLKKLHALRDEREIAERKRLHDRNPNDAEAAWKLGEILARVGRHDEAIRCFQIARHDPAWKVKALEYAGRSFEAKNMAKLAERNYQDALKELDPADEETFKALHYRLGRLAEEHGNPVAAEEHYNEVANLDYNYLDVAQRIQALNA